jgi:NAD+ kinase
VRFNSVVVIRKLDGGKEHQLTDDVIKLILAECSFYRIIPVYIDVFEPGQVGTDTLFIAVGGDGTMIHAMKLAAHFNAHVIGINTGRVGFLNDFSHGRESLIHDLERVFNYHTVETDDRLLIKATINSELLQDHFVAVSVNEFSIAHLESDTILSFDLLIDDQFAGSHRSNSVIVATPTGSTAYSLSAGGAILYPSMDVMEIVPVASLRMASRPIVVNGNSVVKIIVHSSARNGPIIIRSDGQKVLTWDIMNEPIVINISRSEHKARIIHSRNWNFFDVLSTKMGWLG